MTAERRHERTQVAAYYWSLEYPDLTPEEAWCLAECDEEDLAELRRYNARKGHATRQRIIEQRWKLHDRLKADGDSVGAYAALNGQ